MDIIIADDVALMRKILVDILVGHCGVSKPSIHEAADGETAVRDYKRFRPKLIFLDVLMPKKNGQDAIAEIINFDPSAYIVMCSSAGEKHIVEACVTAGAKDYLVKPLDPERVKLALENGGYKPSAG